jgi:hypothetical protein
MVRLADIPAVVELRDACAALRPLVRAFDDAVSAGVVDPPAERAAEASSSTAVVRYQQAIVLANADAAVVENHNISDGLRAEAQLAATDVRICPHSLAWVMKILVSFQYSIFSRPAPQALFLIKNAL